MKIVRNGSLVAFSFLFFSISSGMLFSDDKPGSDPVVIGCIVDLTDPSSPWGPAVKKGAELAVERFNAAAQAGGVRLELRAYEVKSDPLECLNYYIRLADRDRAAAVIGPHAGAGSLALANLSYAKRVPVVSLNPDPRVLERKDGAVQPYMFLIQPSGVRVAEILADYGLSIRGFKRAAVLYDKTSSYASLQAKAFAASWEKSGGKVVADLAFKGGEKNFKANLLRIKEAGADCIFDPAEPEDLALVLGQAAELGLGCPIFGGLAPAKPLNEAFPGVKADRLYFAENYTASEQAAAEVLAAYKGKFGENPVNKAFLGHDAVLVIAEALARAKSSNPLAVRDFLEQVRGLQGATGVITISPKTHQPEGLTPVITAVEGGVLNDLGRYPPEAAKR